MVIENFLDFLVDEELSGVNLKMTVRVVYQIVSEDDIIEDDWKINKLTQKLQGSKSKLFDFKSIYEQDMYIHKKFPEEKKVGFG